MAISERENLPTPCHAVFPDTRPHIVLRGFRNREGLTQAELAARLGLEVTEGHISEMESGKRPIGKAMAKRLAAALNAVGYQVFL